MKRYDDARADLDRAKELNPYDGAIFDQGNRTAHRSASDAP